MSTAKLAFNFGAEVRRRREAMNLTLEELAARSNLTPNYIGGVELDKRDPSLSTVLALARGLGVPAGQLFGASGEISPAALEAAQDFEGLPQEVQAAVLGLLRAVAARNARKLNR